MVDGGGVWGVNKMGEGCQMYKLPVIKSISTVHVMQSIVTIVNNTLLCIWKFLKELFSSQEKYLQSDGF